MQEVDIIFTVKDFHALCKLRAIMRPILSTNDSLVALDVALNTAIHCAGRNPENLTPYIQPQECKQYSELTLRRLHLDDKSVEMLDNIRRIVADNIPLSVYAKACVLAVTVESFIGELSDLISPHYFKAE